MDGESCGFGIGLFAFHGREEEFAVSEFADFLRRGGHHSRVFGLGWAGLGACGVIRAWAEGEEEGCQQPQIPKSKKKSHGNDLKR